MENGVKPIYIFDGKPPDFKEHELAKRKEKRDKAAIELKAAEEAGDTAKVQQMEKRLVRGSREHVKDVQELLTLMGVPWYQAPGEAEAQAARMCAQGVVWGTGTEDMDALTFGTLKQVRRLTDSEAKQKIRPTMEFDLKAVLEGFGMTMLQFVDLCILCGCDYCPTIRGIGPVNAFKFIKKYGSMEAMLENLPEKYIVPENWRFARARELFLKPDVTDKKDLPKFAWNLPKEKELEEFLVERMGFAADRVQTGVKRLKACKKKGSQKRLDNFFKVMPSPAGKGKGKTKGKGKGKGKLAGKKRGRKASGNTNSGESPKKKRTKTKK